MIVAETTNAEDALNGNISADPLLYFIILQKRDFVHYDEKSLQVENLEIILKYHISVL